MISVKDREFIWAQKFRPKSIDECVLPQYLKKIFKDQLLQGQVTSQILSGPRGIGKTSAALAMIEELDGEHMFINSSLSGNIDTLRIDITNYASGVSFSGKRKFVVLDEADNLNPNTTQPGLRAFMEQYSQNVTFFLTCNNLNKIIEPLQSRCSLVEFKIPANEKPALAGEFFKRIQEILKLENVTYDNKVLAAIVTRHFPDFRKTLNELQKMSASGHLDIGALGISNEEAIGQLADILKAKKFTEMRKWVAEHASNSSNFYREIYDMVTARFTNSAMPPAIITIADYQYRDAFAVDKEINITAMLVELMLAAEFK